MDGAFHAVDSSAVAFETAAKAAYEPISAQGGTAVVGPIMKVDVFTPEDHVGDVIGDLNRRRAMIKAQESSSLGSRVKAMPLSGRCLVT